MALQAVQILIDQADRRRDDARIAELYRLATDPRFEGTYFRKFGGRVFLARRGGTTYAVLASTKLAASSRGVTVSPSCDTFASR